MPREVHNQLTAARVAKTTKAGRYADGGGLYLHVSDTGAKSWIWRGVVRGRRRELGLGPVRDYSLLERKMRFGTSAPLMGYERAPVADAFARYCQQPPAQTGTTEQSKENKDLARSRAGTSRDDVPAREASKSLKVNGCSDVPVSRALPADWQDFQ